MTIWIDVRRTVAGALVAHAIVHLLGVMTAWRLSPFHDPPYTTVVLNGTLDAGEAGQLIVGGLWLLAALALVGGAVALWRGTPHLLVLVGTAFAISLAVSLISLPAGRFGVVIDVAALVAIGIGLGAPRLEQLFHPRTVTRSIAH